MKYYIKLDDETTRPFTSEQIKLRIAERAYQKLDIVRPEDSADWVTLGSLPEFGEDFASRPAERNRLAETSLAMGIASPLVLAIVLAIRVDANPLLIFSLFGTYFVLGIGAIHRGHQAISWIKHSLFKVKGIGMAWSGLVLGYMVIIIPIMNIDIITHGGGRIQEKGLITQGINNCKQIIISMRIYSPDSRDIYPDADIPNAKTSNEVFRALFKEGVLETEKIFGCGKSPYVPDGNVGIAPDFLEAVKPGENHWAMTKGLNGSMSGRIPLVFENPSEATWPPKWNANHTDAQPGRTWKKGKVIVGFNDSSVEVLPLESETGESVGLKPYPDGTPVFPVLHPGLEILNVAK
ncbi:hypothetical protein BH11VER1_BH11VER1_07390 [soil metagenome]